ncbi:IclR family transcriptional regulator [Mycolicibacterium moriokaense]|nr:IclR family transcriptional regulator [Mycolicibacterium moriokaense]
MELARALDLHASTAHRILRALVAANYVVQNAQTERYRLGPSAFLLGRAAERTLGFDEAMPLLEQLSAATGESVNLVIRDADEGLVVLRVESEHPLRFIQPVGARIPLYCTSTGITEATITSPRDLLAQLEEIRKRGYSINKGERIPGVYGVAAPVLTSDGIASTALAVQGPEVRIPDERIPELGQLVIKTAQAIAAIMPSGYQL